MTTHKCNKEQEIKEIHVTLKKLEPLAELIEPLQKMVEVEKAKTWLSIRVAEALKFIGIVLGIFGSLFAIGWAIYKELKK